MKQEQWEHKFSKRHSHEVLFDMLKDDEDIRPAIDAAISLVIDWANEPVKYESKQQRKTILLAMDIPEVVQEILCTVIKSRETTLASISGQIGASLGFDDTRQGITLAAELLAIICQTDLIHIYQKYRHSQLYVIAAIQPDEETQKMLDSCIYMPPLLAMPLLVKGSRSSGYHTIKGDSLILGGSRKHHDGDLCVDVLNILNRTKLTINKEFINEVVEEPSKDLFDIDPTGLTVTQHQEAIKQNLDNWYRHVGIAKALYEVLGDYNHFYITNKVDNRGRIYAQGHHVNPMGTGYKKAMLELANKETILYDEDFFTT